MTLYYDHQGKPISLVQWAARMEDMSCNRVAETTLADGKWVSTVWLGRDTGLPALIFETMVFPAHDSLENLDCERYTTEAEALMGHQRMVEKWMHGEPL